MSVVLMPEDVRRIVGNNVKRLRLRSSLTQAALAALLEVDRAYVSGLEQGRRNPTVVTLWHVAQALKVNVRDLLDTLEPGEEEIAVAASRTRGR